MKKHIVLVCVILFSIGLLSTVFSSCQRNQNRGIDDRDRRDRGYDTDRDVTRRDRGSSTSSSSCERSTREGGGVCENDDDCDDQCDDLFNSRDYQECLDLTVNEVQGMWNAFDEDDGILEDPDEDDLEDVHPDDIKNALDIDERIWDDFIDDYGTSEAGDVLYWIATDECIYEAIDDGFDEDDMQGFMSDIFKQADNNLISAALEPLGDDADDDETFLYLADAEGNDKAVELVHELLWEKCLDEAPSSKKSLYTAVEEEDDENSACLLGELYCKQEDDEYIFEDVFESVVDNELDNFIRGGSSGGSNYRDGLGITSSDYDDLEEVCLVVCGNSGNKIGSGNTRPSTCSGS